MELRRLGSSGLFVSTVTLGSFTFTGGRATRVGSTDLAATERMFDEAVDAGVNLVDTADSYHGGTSEEIVGALLRRRPSPEVLVSSKVGLATGPTANDRGSSRHHVLAAAETSLRRLQRDHIDLYHLHMWDGLTPVVETLSALDVLVRSGKVRYVAVSNFAAWQVVKHVATADALHLPRPVAQQIHYTPHVRDPEFDLLPMAADQGLGTLVWGPLAGGLLSGKYRRDSTTDGGRHATPLGIPPVPDRDRLFDIVDELVAVGRERGVTAAQVALAWTLSRPGVTSLVVGATRREQVGRQPGRRAAGALGRGAGADRAGQSSRAAVPVVAPAHGGAAPDGRGRVTVPGAVRPLSGISASARPPARRSDPSAAAGSGTR
ncbi:aldo/keto reductase [Nakamurella leprariae]|uniref:Aldo/keto reductase n=1 Tax=Nakamurella leprariae TaxID=2803911 RepID=A0A939C3C4_9ACTN|nr:aldo/keto reductase [Nakamurella leprariae]MBM9469269.1 aldo/keto reductase [Nakamurella leprariae]